MQKDLKKITELLILTAIVVLGVFLYFHKLDVIPSGFYIDEALPGYNAYSLLETGKDEYGKAFPTALRFYGSYNPPLYTYLTILPVAFLGLTIFSVRFMAAFSGVLSIVVVYYFLKKINLTKSKLTPAVAALLFTISPWAVLYSRVGYEISLAFLLFSVGSLFVWLGFKKPRLLILGLSLLSLSTYVAYTQRFLVPIFILGTLLVFAKKINVDKLRRHLVVGLVVAMIIQIPHLLIITTPAFFPKSGLFYEITTPLAFLREFLSQYFTYFSPRSLFFLPDPDLQRSIPLLSVFYFWMVIPYFIGLYALWKERRKPAVKYVLFLLFITPAVAALTHDPFSTHRALPSLLPMIIVISLGIDRLIYKHPTVKWVPIFLVFIAGSLILLWRSYFVFLPKERAKVWGYGFEQLAKQIKERPDEWFVIDQARIKPAYIQLAFFLQYPPQEFQSKVDQSIKDNYYTKTEFDSHYKFANIETRNINWEEDIYKKQILVGDELTISPRQADEHFLDKVFEIKDPLENIVFVGFKTNPELKCAHISNKNIHCKK